MVDAGDHLYRLAGEIQRVGGNEAYLADCAVQAKGRGESFRKDMQNIFESLQSPSVAELEDGLKTGMSFFSRFVLSPDMEKHARDLWSHLWPAFNDWLRVSQKDCWPSSTSQEFDDRLSSCRMAAWKRDETRDLAYEIAACRALWYPQPTPPKVQHWFRRVAQKIFGDNAVSCTSETRPRVLKFPDLRS